MSLLPRGRSRSVGLRYRMWHTTACTTCQLVGWKDMEMLRRYDIIDKNTLKRRVAKLRTYLNRQKKKQPKVTPISKSLQSRERKIA